jgi:T6SS, Phospholipase effector Tle1-like, catalytic domain
LDNFRPVRIKFVGLFDTVRAAGLEIFRFHSLRLPKEVPGGEHREPWFFLRDEHHSQGTLAFRFTRHLPPNVDRAFHALAVDEHRAVFHPRVWIVPQKDKMTGPLEQRWFIGAHANVGGGYEDDQLRFIPLQWMRDKAMEAGIHFAQPTDEPEKKALEYCEAEVVNSYRKWLWHLYPFISWRKFYRPIYAWDQVHTSGSKTIQYEKQTIDPSVLYRIAKGRGYRPKGVRACLQRSMAAASPFTGTIDRKLVEQCQRELDRSWIRRFLDQL